jgi:hypothetical protein
MQIVTRKEAIEKGLTAYFTGIPCKHGHIAKRHTQNKTCSVCSSIKIDEIKKQNPDKYKMLADAWKQNNKDKLAEYQRTYTKKRPGKRNLLTANYRQAKVERMPEWLNKAHLFEMECVYNYCAALNAIGLKYHVDHIVPLRGESVSGLHAPWNIQVLQANKNMSKGNRFNGD